MQLLPWALAWPKWPRRWRLARWPSTTGNWRASVWRELGCLDDGMTWPWFVDLGVSKNMGKPTKSCHFNRVFHYKPSILGVFPLFLETPNSFSRFSFKWGDWKIFCIVMVQKISFLTDKEITKTSEVRRDFRQHLAALQRNLEPPVFLPNFELVWVFECLGIETFFPIPFSDVESENMAHDKRDQTDHCIVQ